MIFGNICGGGGGGGGWGRGIRIEGEAIYYAVVYSMYACLFYLHPFIHLPPFQARVIESRWELLSVLPGCTASVNPISFKVFQELIAGEEVVEEHVVILVLQIFCQLLHHVCPKSFSSLVSLAGVYIKLAEVAVGTISQYPHFDSTLSWLLGHVLLEAETTLKLDHGL